MVLLAPGHDGGGPRVLLIRRGADPFKGKWALPGGFAEPGETIDDTAARELFEETGVTEHRSQQIGVYSEPGRDPRGWVVSVGFVAAVDEPPVAVAADDAEDAVWAPVADVAAGRYPLAFDHVDVLADGLAHPAAPAGAAGYADRVRAVGWAPAAAPPARPVASQRTVGASRPCGRNGCRHLVTGAGRCAAGHVPT